MLFSPPRMFPSGGGGFSPPSPLCVPAPFRVADLLRGEGECLVLLPMIRTRIPGWLANLALQSRTFPAPSHFSAKRGGGRCCVAPQERAPCTVLSGLSPPPYLPFLPSPVQCYFVSVRFALNPAGRGGGTGNCGVQRVNGTELMGLPWGAAPVSAQRWI